MRVPIIRLEMVVDGYTEYLREQLSTSGKAAEWIWKNIVRNSNREHIIVVGCDAGSCATYIDEVGRGSVYCCPGTIPEIFKAAIISNATRILLFHNHPGGRLQPSQMDKEFTKNVRKAGELLEIELSDHIIIGRDGAYYSFMEANILMMTLTLMKTGHDGVL